MGSLPYPWLPLKPSPRLKPKPNPPNTSMLDAKMDPITSTPEDTIASMDTTVDRDTTTMETKDTTTTTHTMDSTINITHTVLIAMDITDSTITTTPVIPDIMPIDSLKLLTKNETGASVFRYR